MMTRSGRIALGLLLAIVGPTACGAVSEEDVLEAQAAARACGSGDTCVLAGASACTCPAPVNARRAAQVDETANEVSCTRHLVDCVGTPMGDPRCIDGRCSAD